jgi:hypothetical protein
MAVIDGVDLDGLDYVVKVPYNGTGPTGGDSLTQDLNIWYEVRSQNLPCASCDAFRNMRSSRL